VARKISPIVLESKSSLVVGDRAAGACPWYPIISLPDIGIYGRKVVGRKVCKKGFSDNASQLVSKGHLREGVSSKPMVLHSGVSGH